MARKAKPKQIQVQVIPRESSSGEPTQTYVLMDELIARHHPHLSDARIALAWRFGWKPDPDGRLKLGQAKKASDLDRELHTYDFVIVLNFEAWNAADWTRDQMRALLDHELCHCQVAKDEYGEEKTNAAGRPVWRVRGHDTEEFVEIVARHGLWTNTLEQLAAAAIAYSDAPLLTLMQKKENGGKSGGGNGKGRSGHDQPPSRN